MERKKVYLSRGANDLKMKSGDTGFYIDIDPFEIRDTIRRDPSLTNRPGGVLRLFVIPSQREEPGYYKYYVEVAVPDEKYEKSESW